MIRRRPDYLALLVRRTRTRLAYAGSEEAGRLSDNELRKIAVAVMAAEADVSSERRLRRLRLR